ncbi:MAG: TetR family transcriptional regulator [Proteobacteria bacterium]|nr:TetR family transcriptional regulator [Pseudomonadota bacterium]MCZ6783184.1 TetR family transcriptional regulator [Pseudomonadota bacterium]
MAEVAPAPASRRARKKERTRREIYSAAMQLFAERGFDEVTLEQICEAADVARGTFFLHFPSKSALLFEFHREMAGEFAASAGPPGESAVEELGRLVDHLGRGWLERAPVMTAMLRDFLATPESLLHAEEHETDLRELIEDIVRRGQERGELRRGVPPRLAAAVFLSTSLAILSGAVYEPGEVEPAEIRAQFLEVLLRGLVEPESHPMTRATTRAATRA